MHERLRKSPVRPPRVWKDCLKMRGITLSPDPNGAAHAEGIVDINALRALVPPPLRPAPRPSRPQPRTPDSRWSRRHGRGGVRADPLNDMITWSRL
jgi:hypothetical protein